MSRRVRGYVVPALLVFAVIGTALVIERPWTWCPAEWGDATRVELGGPSADVVLHGSPFRVGGGALLDYMPHIVSSPLDQFRASRHPLGITASVSASSRDALGDPAFTCFRATRRSEVWARRPTTYPTQTMADGLPPGAPAPARNEAWRMASINDGPEWQDGERIGLELWMTVNGRHYVFVVAPFALMRGG